MEFAEIVTSSEGTEERRVRRAVRVESVTNEHGIVRPTRLWLDGREWRIDRVIEVSPSTPGPEGPGRVYTIMVGRRMTWLWHEPPMWYVHKRVDA